MLIVKTLSYCTHIYLYIMNSNCKKANTEGKYYNLKATFKLLEKSLNTVILQFTQNPGADTQIATGTRKVADTRNYVCVSKITLNRICCILIQLRIITADRKATDVLTGT